MTAEWAIGGGEAEGKGRKGTRGSRSFVATSATARE